MGLFLAVVGFCVLSFVAMVGSTAPPDRRGAQAGVAGVAVVAWVGVLSIPPATGLVTPEAAVPGVPLMILGVFAMTFAVVFSPLGRRLASEVPLWALVGFQAMRLPLEVVLHGWSDGPLVPVQMTWSGQNLDVFAGITALLLAPFVQRSKGLAWLSQGVGIVLLANVLRVVVLSVPTPLRAFDEPLLLPFSVPHVWIAPVCVGGALVVHGLTVRKLLQRPADRDGVAGSRPSV